MSHDDLTGRIEFTTLPGDQTTSNNYFGFVNQHPRIRLGFKDVHTSYIWIYTHLHDN